MKLNGPGRRNEIGIEHLGKMKLNGPGRRNEIGIEHLGKMKLNEPGRKKRDRYRTFRKNEVELAGKAETRQV